MSNYFKEWQAQRKQQKIELDLGTYYKFDPPVDPRNYHYFLGEPLLVPKLFNCDAQRVQMFSSHITQTVHLKNPEYPKVFTNFENAFGEYSMAYSKAKENFKILAKIQKNISNYDLIVQYTGSKIYDIIHYRQAGHITEDYGYMKNDCLKNKTVNDIVNEGDYLYKSPNYDEEGNFGYGVNLKAAYYPWMGLTFEDAIVVSKSAAEKLTSYKVEEITVSVNSNDVLLNLYSDNNEKYHSVPHVGEHTKDNILVASRRIDNQTLLYNFQYDKMKKVLPEDDITYTVGGIISDIDIYCNASLDVLRSKNNYFTKEIVELIDAQNKYYETCKEELEKILPVATEKDLLKVMSAEEKTAYYAERSEYGYNWTRPMPKQLLNGIKYTEEFGYFWKQVHEYLDNRIQWRTKGKSFQNFKIKFTVLKENKLTIGAKLTGR